MTRMSVDDDGDNIWMKFSRTRHQQNKWNKLMLDYRTGPTDKRHTVVNKIHPVTHSVVQELALWYASSVHVTVAPWKKFAILS